MIQPHMVFYRLARRIATALSAAVLLLTCPLLPSSTASALTAADAGASIGAAPAAAPAPLASAPPMMQGETQSVVVGEVAGLVEVQETGTGVWRSVQKGDLLKAGDRIRTGPDGLVHMEFDGKIRVQILPDAELTIEEAHRQNERARRTLLKLDIGKIRADVDKLGPDSTFQIRTPTAVSSVRGTTLYLSVVRFAQGLAGVLTDLYVEKGKVDFAALEDKIESVLVEAFHSSSAGGEGGVTEPKELSPEERAALVQTFVDAFQGAGNPQFGVETAALPGGPGTPGGGAAGEAIRNAVGQLIDDLIEFRNENAGIDDDGENIASDLLGALKSQALRLSEGVRDELGGFTSGNFVYGNIDYEDDRFDELNANDFNSGIVTNERGDRDDAGSLLGGILAADSLIEAAFSLEELQALRNREKQQLRESLDGILNDQRFRTEDAEQEKEFDAQTGKVFTDVHGNRVRTDQYIYHEPGSDLVRLVSLTLRTGEYQTGITSVEFGTRFNDTLPEGTLLRDLPWNDYLNVVTDEEFNAAHPSGRAESYSDQYIVHESSGAEEPALYPVDFYAEFKNPAGDRIRFSESYSSPFSGEFSFDKGETTDELWFQARIFEMTEIAPVDGFPDLEEDTIYYGRELDGDYWESFGNGEVYESHDGSQTQGLADAEELIGELDSEDGFNTLENLEQNDDRIVDNDLHPAYFQDYIAVGYEDELTLNALFLPIDNLGQVIDAPGFRVEGLRDLMNPNSLVAGGKYNLEVILSFGRTYSEYVDHGEYGEYAEYFEEDFRIDAIITPEIFQPYGIDASSARFADRLVDDKDDGGDGEQCSGCPE